MTMMKKTKEVLGQIKPLADQGLSAEEIGESVGITRNSVVGLIKRWGASYDIHLQGEINEKKRRAAVRARNKKFGTDEVVPPPSPKGEVKAERSPSLYYPKPQNYHAGKKHKITCCWAGCSNEPVASGKPFCIIHR
jgi:hypothetical protein